MAKAAKSTAPDFNSILDAAPSEVERPLPLPVGSYLCVVKGMPEHGKSSQKQTPFVKFNLGYLQAGDDVDTDELKDILKGAALTDKSINHTLYITEASVWRIDEFLEHCGIELDGKKSRTQMIEETPGCQVMVSIKHEASQDGTAVFAKVAQTAKAE